MEQHTRATGSKHTEHSGKGSAVGDIIGLVTYQSYSFREPFMLNTWHNV